MCVHSKQSALKPNQVATNIDFGNPGLDINININTRAAINNIIRCIIRCIIRTLSNKVLVIHNPGI